MGTLDLKLRLVESAYCFAMCADPGVGQRKVVLRGFLHSECRFGLFHLRTSSNFHRALWREHGATAENGPPFRRRDPATVPC
jgi:hypothetical protein